MIRFAQKICLLLVVLTACSGEDDSQDVFEVTLSNTIIGERTGDVLVNLSSPLEEDLVITYEIVGGTALLESDFEANSGQVTIPAGETQQPLGMSIVNDEHSELEEAIEVEVSYNEISFTNTIIIEDDDPVNARLVEEDEEGFFTPATYPSMRLLWSEEFDDSSLDTDYWTYDLGDGCDQGICGWGNQELQTYTEENAVFADGRLTITAGRDASQTLKSARITTKDKFQFQFGRMDIRAKLPKGQGIWPALWLLGANIDDVSWPASGEIDVMELVGHEPNKVHGTVHYDLNGHNFVGSSLTLNDADFSEEFHVFSLVWDRNVIRWYVDYRLFYTVTDADLGGSYPFNLPFYVLVNVAIGGQWPGSPDETTVFPQEMVLDYIRVFQ